MFGLMRAKMCGMSAEEKNFRRLHYCGTCKTIGSLYGQKARFLLNLDVVFLAELLDALAGENPQDWHRAYQSYNCLSLPETKKMPIALSFAATTNVILTKFKLEDHLSDSNKRRYKLADRAFSKEFQTAQRRLRDWNFPLEKVKEILSEQTKIEAKRTAGENWQKSLENYANPTAQTTAIFFAEGVKLTGRAESAGIASEIGFAFGKLIYLLDAFEDYEKDLRENQFNAIGSAFQLAGNKIPGRIKRQIVSILREIESGIIENLYRLPIAESQKAVFALRLGQNLQRKLAADLPVLETKKNHLPRPPRLSFSERWRKARQISSQLTTSLQSNWAIPLVFAFVFIIALFAPVQAEQAKSWRECASLSFNLMFLGAIFGSVFVSAKSVLMRNPAEDSGAAPPPTPQQDNSQNVGNSGSSGNLGLGGFCCTCLDLCGNCAYCCEPCFDVASCF